MTHWELQGQALYTGLKDKAFEALERDCGMGHNAWERNRQGFAGWLCCALLVLISYGARHG